MFEELKNRVRRFGEVRKQDGLIWGLIAFWEGIYFQILALVTFLGEFTILFLGDWVKALVLIASMYLHELGHWVVLRMQGVDAIMALLPPLGAVAAPRNKAENKKSDEKDWYSTAWMIQMGPIANVALMFVGSWLAGMEIDWMKGVGADLIMLNGILAVSNLVPVWKLDAAQLVFVIFSSLKEHFDTALAWVVTGLAGVGLVGVIIQAAATFDPWMLVGSLLLNLKLVVFAIFLVAGVWHFQGKDDPKHAESHQAMTVGQAALHIAVYLVVAVVALSFA